jgi:type IV pilus assembly protein PilA
MLEKFSRRIDREDGFTLIELLVVILIIGILAAIAIPSFLNQRYKGQDACAKSMAKQMQTAAKTFQTDNNTYVGISVAALSMIESSITGSTSSGNCAPLGVGATASGGSCSGTASATQYCVSAASLSSNTFAIAESGGAVTRTCSIPASGNAGGCKGTVGGNGTW